MKADVHRLPEQRARVDGSTSRSRPRLERSGSFWVSDAFPGAADTLTPPRRSSSPGPEVGEWMLRK